MCNGLGGDTFKENINMFFDLDLGVKVTRNIVKYHLHYVIYAPAKFEFAMSNSFGGDAFTKNTFLAFDLDIRGRVKQNVVQHIHIMHSMYTCKVSKCYIQR